MNRLFCGFGACKGTLLGIALLALAPGSLQAAWLGFRNDVNVPVIVQGGVVVIPGKQIRWDKPRLLYPGEIFWDAILKPGNKIISIYEAKKPNRMVYQDTITISEDVFYSIQPDPPGKVKLIKTKMPKPPQRPPG
jgi:hypothetical protein